MDEHPQVKRWLENRPPTATTLCSAIDAASETSPHTAKLYCHYTFTCFVCTGTTSLNKKKSGSSLFANEALLVLSF